MTTLHFERVEMLKKFTAQTVKIPLTVPQTKQDVYNSNYLTATHQTGRLFLFAGDQKIEHLNEDFYGEAISNENNYPKHLFDIASQARISCFATQLGLIARYAQDYSSINYLVKLNSKTNLSSVTASDPISKQLTTIDQVIRFQQETSIPIIGVGYTVYLGSIYEHIMLQEAAQIVLQAHAHGLLVVLWMYPRGKSVENEQTGSIIAGAAGVGLCLGADFVKVNRPETEESSRSAELLRQATSAAGRTGVICSGGTSRDEKIFLQELYHQLHTGQTRGAAIGRNIHQKSLIHALSLSEAIASLIFDDADLSTALNHLQL